MNEVRKFKSILNNAFSVFLIPLLCSSLFLNGCSVSNSTDQSSQNLIKKESLSSESHESEFQSESSLNQQKETNMDFHNSSIDSSEPENKSDSAIIANQTETDPGSNQADSDPGSIQTESGSISSKTDIDPDSYVSQTDPVSSQADADSALSDSEQSSYSEFNSGNNQNGTDIDLNIPEPLIGDSEALSQEEPETAEYDNETSIINQEQSYLSSIRLPVPEVIQQTGFWCVPACLQMVLFYHGLHFEQKDLADWMKTSDITGTEYEDLARVATDLIFTSQGIPGKYQEVIFTSSDGTLRNQFEQQALADLCSGDPVFVSINNQVMYQDVGESVHMVVLYGADINSEGQIETFYYLDPSTLRGSAQYGHKHAVTADELWNAMLNNPEPGYVY